MKTVVQVRKENLVKIILDKFHGNNTAFGRAAGIHHNHVNLLVTENENTKRNMGEALARRIENALSLPSGWMDTQHGDTARTFSIRAIPMDVSVSRVLVTCKDYGSIEVTNRWEMRVAQKITAVENLSLATISTPEMEPLLVNSSNVIIDTGAKGFGADGVYILTRGDAAFIRNVRRTMDGGHVLEAANPMYRSDKPEQLKGIKVVAKVLMSVGETFA